MLPGASVKVPLAGLWRNADGSAATAASFTKSDGAAWLSVDSSGTVHGTAPAAADPDGGDYLLVDAVGSDGSHQQISVDTPISATPASVRSETLTAWDSGSHVQRPVEKLAQSVLFNRVDVLGLQDAAALAGPLAQALGFHVATSGGQAILSRYPLTQQDAGSVPAVRATVDSPQGPLTVFSAGLDATSPSISVVCSSGASAAESAERASTRYAQAAALAALVSKDPAQSSTVLLGALNSPTSADWTAARNHCGAGAVHWPASDALLDAGPANSGSANTGLADAFRTVSPDPVTDPGTTTDVIPAAAALAAGANQGAAAPGPQRTDVVLLGNRLKPSLAHTVIAGFPQGGANVAKNSWISNHAAVLTEFVATHDAGGSPSSSPTPSDLTPGGSAPSDPTPGDPTPSNPTPSSGGVGPGPTGSTGPTSTSPVGTDSTGTGSARAAVEPLAATGPAIAAWALLAVLLLAIGSLALLTLRSRTRF